MPRPRRRPQARPPPRPRVVRLFLPRRLHRGDHDCTWVHGRAVGRTRARWARDGDGVGLLGGDWLKVRRAENLARILEKATERLRARHLETPEPASLSIALPILVAAGDESRDELQEIWARLLAAAADPGRAKSFRLAFIEATKKLDPLDAAVLQGISAAGGAVTPGMRNSLAEQLHASRNEIDISIANLTKLELVNSGRHGSPEPAQIMPLGREFLRAVSD
jgi:hypothetical protein